VLGPSKGCFKSGIGYCILEAIIVCYTVIYDTGCMVYSPELMQDSVLQSGWCHWSLQNAIMNGLVDSVNRFCIQLDTMYFVY